MKKIATTLFALMLICQFAFSQYSDKGFSFQGYAIDADDRAIASTNVTVKFTVSGTVGATTQTYAEEHALTTDSYGIFSATVGDGNKDDATSNVSFEELNFTYYDFKLKVEVKKTSGGTYTTISDKMLNSVPYARSAANGVPVGTVVAFAGPTTQIPDGWLLCDGTSYNASSNLKYAQLFVAIGTTWGGSGSSAFNVPDFRGEFLRGLNEETTGRDSTRTLGSHQSDDILSHNHTTVDAGIHSHGIGRADNSSNSGAWNGSGWDLGWGISQIDGSATQNGSVDIDNPTGSPRKEPNLSYAVKFPTSTDAEHGLHGHTINNTGGKETRPHNYAVNYIIKY